MTKRVTVTDWRGNNKKVTRQEFITEWLAHGEEMAHLVDYSELESTQASYNKLMASIEDMAGTKFDLIFKRREENV